MRTTKPILLVEDEPIGQSFVDAFREKGYDVDWYRAGDEVMKAYRSDRDRWSAAALDISLLPSANKSSTYFSDNGGFLLLRDLRAEGFRAPAVFWTAFAADKAPILNQRPEFASIRDTRMLSKADGIRAVATTTLEMTQPAEAARRRRLIEDYHLDDLPDLAPVLQKVKEAAIADRHILLYGEPGVGKEAIARYYAFCSGRAGQFRSVNCGSLVGEGGQLTLLGRADGFPVPGTRGFGGAFEEVGHGIVYLEDLDKFTDATDRQMLPILYAMETREVTRMGAARPTPVQAVVVASINDPQRLSDPVRSRFRFEIRVPPLRERPRDLVVLARFLRARAVAEETSTATSPDITPDDAQALLGAYLPFNIRSLQRWADGDALPPAAGPPIPAADPAVSAPSTPARRTLPLSIGLDAQNRALYQDYFGHEGDLQRDYWLWLAYEHRMDFEGMKRASGVRSEHLLKALLKFGIVVPGMTDRGG